MSRRSITRPEVRVGGFWLSSIVPQGWGQLRHATRVNGGWQVSWSIPNTRTWRHPALVRGALVELQLGPVCIVPATLEEPDWDSGEFVALGACRDGETAVSITAAGATTTAPNTSADAAAARGAVSWNRVADFGATPVGQADSSGGLVSVQSVFDAWAQENDSNWAIANNRTRDLIIAPIDEDDVDWLIVPGSGVLGSASEERVDRIFVRYVATNGTRATASYPAVTPVGGVEKPVDITDRGPMSSAKAASIAEGMWSDLQGRSGWTNGLTLRGGQITTVGGVEADLALVKGGDTARLLGVQDQRGVALHTNVVIGDTDYDWEEDEIQVNPVGLAARDTESVLEQVGNLAVDAMAKASAPPGRAHIERGKASTQSIPDNTWTTVMFGNDVLTDGMTYASGVLTATQAGRYDVRGYVQWAANATGRRLLRVRKNGAEVESFETPTVAGGNVTRIKATVTVALAAGDTVDVQGLQTSGTGLNVETTSRLTVEQLA